MPAQVILVEAQPARAADGIAETIRLAGGGALVPYTYSGQTDWRAGVVGLPTLIASLEYEGGEFPAGSVPAAAAIEWAPSNTALLSATASYVWADAPITVRIGSEGAALPPVRISGKVLDAKASGGKLTIALADPATGLKKPLLTARFAGTGGLEGPAEWNGQIRRRVWGRVWNLSGDPLDTANNIYCFADPLRPLQAFDAVRDKGAPAAALTVLAWQGSAAATFAALQAASAPAGGGVVCPSIACVKWWTQPAGELCADLRGEVGSGYVETTAGIAQRLVEAIGGPAFTAGTVTGAAAARPAPVGWVAKDDTSTVAAMLDELLGNSSLLWLLDDNGAITIRTWTWGASVASATSQDVSREQVLRPLATRKLGYKRNETPMQRGDLAAIVLSSEVAYLDGTSIEVLKPAQPGATAGATVGGNLRLTDGNIPNQAQVITAEGTAAAIANQGSLATQNNVNLGNQVAGLLPVGNAAVDLRNNAISISIDGILNGAGGGQVTIGGLGYTGALNATYGARAGTNIYRTDGATVMSQAELRTAEGTAAAIAGQGSLATKSQASWLTDVANRPPVDEVYHDFAFASIAAAQAAGHVINNSSTCSIEVTGSSPGGAALVLGDGVTALQNQWFSPEWIPYNGNDLYEVVFDVEIMASDAAATFYAGVEARDRAGNNLGASYNYVAASAKLQNANLGRRLFKGYLTGFTSGTTSGEGTTPETAKGLPDGSAFAFGQGGAVRFRPVVYCNYLNRPGQVKLHAVRVTRIPAKLAVQDEIAFGGFYLKEATGGTIASLANFKTGLGTAAAITGQGALATANAVNLTSQVSGTLGTANAAAGLLNSNISIAANGALSGAGGGSVTIGGLGFLGDLDATRGARVGVNLRNSADTAYLGDADVVTAAGTAAAIAGQGALATQSSLAYGGAYLTGFGGLAGLASVNFGSGTLLETSGGAQATLANFKTGLGTAAAITGQGALATANAVNLASQVSGTLGTANAAAGLLNSNISIAANGALSGAGGGSVTIGGLGYTGALNATFGARVGVNLRNSADTAYLGDADVVTAAGTAAAIAGQGALATANAVNLASQVSGTLGTANAAAGLLNSNISIAANGTLSGAGGGSVTIGGLGYTGALNATYGARAGTNIYRTDGATVMSQAELRTAEGTAAAITGQGALATANAVNLASQVSGTLGTANAAAGLLNSNISIAANGALSGAGGGAVTIGGLGYTGALNATFGARVGVNLRNSADTAYLGDADVVTAAGTAAAIASQGALATKSAVNLASAEVTNKSLANLDGTASTKLGGIETGATVGGVFGANLRETAGGTVATLAAFKTASGTAAAIAGQGALATQSSLAYGGAYLTGFGGLAALASVNFGSSTLLETNGGAQATLANFKTGLGTAAAITGQGALATANAVNLASQVSGTLGTANAAAGLLNSNISIAANGALSGAGGGSVTIGGLGYTGALNATYGARAGTNIYRTDGATVMSQAELRTAEGTAAAIAGQGSLATKSQASWLTDVANRPPVDEVYHDFAFASIAAAQAAGHVINGSASCSIEVTSNSPGGAALVLGDGATALNNLWFAPEFIPYNGNDLYEVVFDVEIMASDAAATFYAGVEARDRAGNNLGLSYNYVAAVGKLQNSNLGRRLFKGYLTGFTSGTTSGEGTTPETAKGLPDGSAFAFGFGGTVRFRPMVYANFSSRPGQVKLHAVRVTRIPAKLAVQDEIAFGGFYLKEATGGTIASLANFKTGLGTAAAIAGQGSLATANAVNLSSQVSGTLGTANAAAGLLNSNISIAANGALSGAGGGSVTIGGLGFLGDLDATRGARVGVNLRNSADTAYLGDADVVTAAGTAAAIASQGALATKSAVNLASAEVTNKSLANLDGTANTKLTGIETGATVGGVFGTNLRETAGGTVATLAAFKTASGTAAAIAGQGALATANAVNLASQVSGTLGTANAAAGLLNSNISIAANGALSGAGGGSVTIGGLGYTGALNATFGARVGVNLRNSADTAYLGDADVVTAAGTAAAIAGQGALATKSAVNLASAEVTNKSLANLDGTANTKLTGIETGATVGGVFGMNLRETAGGAVATLAAFKTASGTAAAIAGQGYLATQNAVVASRLSLAGYDNIIPDSDYRDPAWWGFAALPNIGFLAMDSYWEQARALSFICDRDFDFSSAYFNIEPGATYRVRTRIWNNDGGAGWTGAFWALIHMPNVAWWSLKHGTGVSPTTVDANNAIVAIGDTGVQEFYFRATSTTMRNIQFRFKSTARGSRVDLQVMLSKVPQLGRDLIKSGTATKYLVSEIETGLGTAAAITGQGAGATANTLAQLDTTAASQLAALANVSKQTAAYGETIKRRLAAGAAVALDAIVNCNGGGLSGSIRARIDARPYGGTWSTVATGAGSSTGPGEPGGDSVAGTFTNSTGAEQMFEFRVVDVRTPSGAGGTIIYPQSYVTG